MRQLTASETNNVNGGWLWLVPLATAVLSGCGRGGQGATVTRQDQLNCQENAIADGTDPNACPQPGSPKPGG